MKKYLTLIRSYFLQPLGNIKNKYHNKWNFWRYKSLSKLVYEITVTKETGKHTAIQKDLQSLVKMCLEASESSLLNSELTWRIHSLWNILCH